MSFGMLPRRISDSGADTRFRYGGSQLTSLSSRHHVRVFVRWRPM